MATKFICSTSFPTLEEHRCLWWALRDDQVAQQKPKVQSSLRNPVEAFRALHPDAASFVIIGLNSQGNRLTVPGSSEPNRPSVKDRSEYIRTVLKESLRGQGLFGLDVHNGSDGQRKDYEPSFLGISGPADSVLDRIADEAKKNYRLDIFLSLGPGARSQDADTTVGAKPKLRIDREGFKEFVLEVAARGGSISTVAGRATFKVRVVPKGLEFTPDSSGTPRLHRWSYVERVLDVFSESGSLKVSDYSFTMHASYHLALIEAFVNDSAESFWAGDNEADSAPEVSRTSGLLRPATPATNSNSKTSKRSGERRSSRAKYIGDVGEKYALEFLKGEASKADWTKLRWVAEAGEKPGWDIEFYDAQGRLIAVEVKATTEKSFASIELTEREWTQAQQLKDSYWLILVAEALTEEPKLEIIENPAALVENNDASISPTRYRFGLSHEK